MEKSKNEMLKLLKIAIVTSTNKTMTEITFKLDEKYTNLLPKAVQYKAGESGDVAIRCEFIDNFLGPYLEMTYPWQLNFVSDDVDESTSEDTNVTFKDILLFLTSLQYYIEKDDLDTVIVSKDVILTRKDLTTNSSSCYESLACYRLLDYNELY
jgi:hypothetical protein